MSDRVNETYHRIGTGMRVTPAALAAVARDAALRVGDLLRGGFAAGAAVTTKADFHDLVTEHDRRAEQVIRAHLVEAVPDSRVIGEEDGAYGAAGAGGVTWYVDPIDGTNNFASGIPFFCVSIGAVHDGELVAGVVYDPLREEVFTADPRGAALDGVPIRSRRALADREAVLATDFPTHQASGLPPGPSGDYEALAEMVRSFRIVRRLGSGALMLAYVAAGRIDVTLGLTAKPWDVAAGALLVTAAGGSYLPLVRASGDPDDALWAVPGYVAHVAGFDLATSCLGELPEALRRTG